MNDLLNAQRVPEEKRKMTMQNEILDDLEIVSLRETARIIRACVRSVYRLIDDGELPQPIKIRSRSFLPLAAVRAYLVKQGLPATK